jgi:hypothetical protein
MCRRGPFLLVVGRIQESATQKYCPFEVNLSPEQVEDHEERSLRDFPLLLDRCAHAF